MPLYRGCPTEIHHGGRASTARNASGSPLPPSRPSLHLSLKRFAYDPVAEVTKKLYKYVHYPQRLEMRKAWCAPEDIHTPPHYELYAGTPRAAVPPDTR